MKKTVTAITVAVVFFIAGGFTVLGAMQWSGSQDVQNAKDNIVVISDLFQRKNDKIQLQSDKIKELEGKIKDTNGQLADKDKVIADKDKIIVQKENELKQQVVVVQQLQAKVDELNKANGALNDELSKTKEHYENLLEVAKQDVQRINELLGEVVKNNQ